MLHSTKRLPLQTDQSCTTLNPTERHNYSRPSKQQQQQQQEQHLVFVPTNADIQLPSRGVTMTEDPFAALTSSRSKSRGSCLYSDNEVVYSRSKMDAVFSQSPSVYLKPSVTYNVGDSPALNCVKSQTNTQEDKRQTVSSVDIDNYTRVQTPNTHRTNGERDSTHKEMEDRKLSRTVESSRTKQQSVIRRSSSSNISNLTATVSEKRKTDQAFSETNLTARLKDKSLSSHQKTFALQSKGDCEMITRPASAGDGMGAGSNRKKTTSIMSDVTSRRTSKHHSTEHHVTFEDNTAPTSSSTESSVKSTRSTSKSRRKLSKTKVNTIKKTTSNRNETSMADSCSIINPEPSSLLSKSKPKPKVERESSLDDPFSKSKPKPKAERKLSLDDPFSKSKPKPKVERVLSLDDPFAASLILLPAKPPKRVKRKKRRSLTIKINDQLSQTSRSDTTIVSSQQNSDEMTDTTTDEQMSRRRQSVTRPLSANKLEHLHTNSLTEHIFNRVSGAVVVKRLRLRKSISDCGQPTQVDREEGAADQNRRTTISATFEFYRDRKRHKRVRSKTRLNQQLKATSNEISNDSTIDVDDGKCNKLPPKCRGVKMLENYVRREVEGIEDDDHDDGTTYSIASEVRNRRKGCKTAWAENNDGIRKGCKMASGEENDTTIHLGEMEATEEDNSLDILKSDIFDHDDEKVDSALECVNVSHHLPVSDTGILASEGGRKRTDDSKSKSISNGVEECCLETQMSAAWSNLSDATDDVSDRESLVERSETVGKTQTIAENSSTKTAHQSSKLEHETAQKSNFRYETAQQKSFGHNNETIASHEDQLNSEVSSGEMRDFEHTPSETTTPPTFSVRSRRKKNRSVKLRPTLDHNEQLQNSTPFSSNLSSPPADAQGGNTMASKFAGKRSQSNSSKREVSSMTKISSQQSAASQSSVSNKAANLVKESASLTTGKTATPNTKRAITKQVSFTLDPNTKSSSPSSSSIIGKDPFSMARSNTNAFLRPKKPIRKKSRSRSAKRSSSKSCGKVSGDSAEITAAKSDPKVSGKSGESADKSEVRLSDNFTKTAHKPAVEVLGNTTSNAAVIKMNDEEMSKSSITQSSAVKIDKHANSNSGKQTQSSGPATSSSKPTMKAETKTSNMVVTPPKQHVHAAKLNEDNKIQPNRSSQANAIDNKNIIHASNLNEDNKSKPNCITQRNTNDNKRDGSMSASDESGGAGNTGDSPALVKDGGDKSDGSSTPSKRKASSDSPSAKAKAKSPAANNIRRASSNTSSSKLKSVRSAQSSGKDSNKSKKGKNAAKSKKAPPPPPQKKKEAEAKDTKPAKKKAAAVTKPPPPPFKGWDGGRELAPHTMTELPGEVDVASMLLTHAARQHKREEEFINKSIEDEKKQDRSFMNVHPDAPKKYLAKHRLQEMFTDLTANVLQERPNRPMEQMGKTANMMGRQLANNEEILLNCPALRSDQSKEHVRLHGIPVSEEEPDASRRGTFSSRISDKGNKSFGSGARDSVVSDDDSKVVDSMLNPRGVRSNGEAADGACRRDSEKSSASSSRHSSAPGSAAQSPRGGSDTSVTQGCRKNSGAQ